MNDSKRRIPDEDDYRHAVDNMGTFIDATSFDLREIEKRAEIYAKIRAKKNVAIKEVMTKPAVTIYATQSLPEAAHILCSKRISTLPVVNAERQLVGIVTESDFLEAIGIPAHHPSHTILQSIESIFTENPSIKSPAGNVENIMSKKVYSAQEDDPIRDAISLMKKRRVRHLVICDENKSVTGVLSQSDLIRLFFQFSSLNP